jgi:hypothetical protein
MAFIRISVLCIHFVTYVYTEYLKQYFGKSNTEIKNVLWPEI